jgi:hypothetical protein
MAGRLAGFPAITPEEALAALRFLVAKGRLKNDEVRRAVKAHAELVEELEASLKALGGEGLRFLRGPEALRRRTRQRRVSAKARAAWKAQGRYLAAVRRLSKAARAKVRAIRKAKSIEAAIAEAKRIARS